MLTVNNNTMPVDFVQQPNFSSVVAWLEELHPTCHNIRVRLVFIRDKERIGLAHVFIGGDSVDSVSIIQAVCFGYSYITSMCPRLSISLA